MIRQIKQARPLHNLDRDSGSRRPEFDRIDRQAYWESGGGPGSCLEPEPEAWDGVRSLKIQMVGGNGLEPLTLSV